MPATIRERLQHILDATANIRTLLAEKSIDSLRTEPATRAALERFIEIISEASRHVPAEFKSKHPQISWIDIANISRLRYRRCSNPMGCLRFRHRRPRPSHHANEERDLTLSRIQA
ncbi:MAG: HepT-like ribonuclease domain-containing protein [Methylovirgula sp.]